MSAKPFTAELQRRGLPFRHGASADLETVAKPELAVPVPVPTATPAELMAAIDRIERRLDELAALQPVLEPVPAPGPAHAPGPAPAPGPDVADLQQRIQATHIEIAALRHPKAEQDRLVVAGEELAAIVSATEHATKIGRAHV